MIYGTKKYSRLSHIIFLSIIVAITSLSGCKTQKSTIADNMIQSPMPHNNAERLSEIVGRYGRWEKLRMPVTVKVTSPSHMSVSGTVTMEYGKSILLSLRMIGMEVAVIYINDDSVLIADKFHKRYFSDKTSLLLAGFDAKVANLQNLLLGRLFQLGETEIPHKIGNFTSEITGNDQWILQAENRQLQYGFKFYPWNILIGAAFSVAGYDPVTVEYGMEKSTPYGVFASSIEFSAIVKKRPLAASLSWNVDKARWNDDVELRVPSFGSNYRRLTLAEVSNMF